MENQIKRPNKTSRIKNAMAPFGLNFFSNSSSLLNLFFTSGGFTGSICSMAIVCTQNYFRGYNKGMTYEVLKHD